MSGTVDVLEQFPIGTSVNVYAEDGRFPLDGTPQESVLATATVGADGTLTIPLTDGDYQLHAVVNGAHVWKRAQTSSQSSSVVNASQLVVPVGAPSGDATGATDLATVVAAVATAKAAGGGTVKLRAGQTYTLNTPNSKNFLNPSGGTSAKSYGVQVPSNVTLDGNGATLQAAAGSTGLLVCNETTTAVTDVNVGVVNCTFDGGGNTQTSGLALICWTNRPVLKNLRAQNGAFAGIWCYGNALGDYDELVSDGIVGGGLSLGQPYATAMESLARIGRIAAYNTANAGSFNNPGNGIYLVATNTTFQEMVSSNNAGGIKIDRPSNGITGGEVLSYNTATGNGSSNSGLKIQGGTSSSATTSSSPQDVHIAKVTSIGQWGTGLFMEQTVDCSVADYVGVGNATLGTYPDVWIGGTRDTITRLKSTGAGGIAVNVRSYATDYTIGTLVVLNPNRLYVAAPSTTVAAGSNGQTNQPAAPYNTPSTISVASTAGFPYQGSFTVAGDTVAYTGISGNSFTGCTGGTHTMTTGAAVVFVTTAANYGLLASNGSVGSVNYAKCMDHIFLPVGVAVTTSPTGGAFGAGPQFWVLTATNANGETAASTEVSATFGTTTIGMASDNAVLPQATVNVVSTAGFPATGSFTVDGQTVSYTGISGNSFTGCTGGVGTIRAGDQVLSTATTFSAAFTWLASTGATGYKLYRATSTGGQTAASSLAATIGNVTAYTDTGGALSAGSKPTYNSATTLGMYQGIAIGASAKCRINSAEITGWANAAYSSSGLTRAQQIATGPPWVGQFVLSAEPSIAVGASYGKIIKSGFYDGADVNNLVATAQPANGLPWAMPLVLAQGITTAAVGINVGTVGDAGSTVALCIWADDGNGRPGSLLLYAGSVAGDGSTGYKEKVSGADFTAIALAAGRYWLGGITQNVTVTAPKLYGATGACYPFAQTSSGANATTAVTGYGGYTGANQGNAAPGAFASPAAAGGGIPRAVVKAA